MSTPKTNENPIPPLADAIGSALRWKPMDVVFADNIRRPRRLVLEASETHPCCSYTTCSESDGVGYHSENSMKTLAEWLTWIEKFREDLTGRDIREAIEAATGPFVEPDSWTAFRERYAATGDPWLPNTERSDAPSVR